MSPSGDPKCKGVDLDRNFPTPGWKQGPHVEVTTSKSSQMGSGHGSKVKNTKIVVSIDKVQQPISRYVLVAHYVNSPIMLRSWHASFSSFFYFEQTIKGQVFRQLQWAQGWV